MTWSGGEGIGEELDFPLLPGSTYHLPVSPLFLLAFCYFGGEEKEKVDT